MPLAENSWIGLLAWFPTQVRLLDGAALSWILWSGLLDGWDWVLYSVVDGAMN